MKNGTKSVEVASTGATTVTLGEESRPYAWHKENHNLKRSRCTGTESHSPTSVSFSEHT